VATIREITDGFGADVVIDSWTVVFRVTAGFAEYIWIDTGKVT
jgi:hypothetical protein